MNISRSEAVRKYFTKTPTKPIESDYSSNQTRMGIGGGLLVFALIFLSSGQGLLVLLGIASGYFGFKFLSSGFSEYSKQKKEYEENCSQYEKDYERAEPKPSDEQMDQWMNADLALILKESLRKLDLLEEGDYQAKPLVIGGPANLDETQYASGRDGKVRYSHLNVLTVYLSDHNISTYQCTHALIHGQTLSDSTQEFPYKEITNLQIKTINKEIHLVNGRRDSVNGVQQFALYTSGANVIEVVFSFSRNADQQDELVEIGSEDTIKAVRKKLEEYKKKYSR